MSFDCSFSLPFSFSVNGIYVICVHKTFSFRCKIYNKALYIRIFSIQFKPIETALLLMLKERIRLRTIKWISSLFWWIEILVLEWLKLSYHETTQQPQFRFTIHFMCVFCQLCISFSQCECEHNGIDMSMKWMEKLALKWEITMALQMKNWQMTQNDKKWGRNRRNKMTTATVAKLFVPGSLNARSTENCAYVIWNMTSSFVVVVAVGLSCVCVCVLSDLWNVFISFCHIRLLASVSVWEFLYF